jgi:allantoinase
MIPAHDSFYDIFSKGKRVKIHWPNGAKLAVTLAGNLEAWTERPDPKLRRTRHAGGSNPITAEDVRCKYDFRTASENDYGGRTGVWRILRVLEKHGLKGSFNINGLAAIKYPEAVKKIHADGHEIVCHNYAEDIQSVFLTKEEEREDIRTCVKIFQDLIGVRPNGCLSSGMRHTEYTLELLAEEGFLWHGDAVNDDVPYLVEVKGKTLVEVPYRNAISGLNDTGMYRRGLTARDLLAAFKDEFDLLYEESESDPKMLTMAMHCQMAFPATGKVYEEAIKYAKSFPKVWFARRIDVVRWVLDHCRDPE